VENRSEPRTLKPMCPSGPMPPRKKPMPLVDALQGLLLQRLLAARSLAVAQAQVHLPLGPDLFQPPPRGQADAAAVDQQGPRAVQAEALQVVAADIVVEAVVVQRVDRVELVDLHETQGGEGAGPARIQAPLLQLPLHLRPPPTGYQAADLLDEVFGGAPRGKADHPFGVALHPLQEAHGRQFAQGREVGHRDHPEALAGILEGGPRGLEGLLFHAHVEPHCSGSGGTGQYGGSRAEGPQ
jgi:hypothetical protein